MNKRTITYLVLACAVGLGWSASNAQVFPENHYLVYDVAEQYTVDLPIAVFDQFNPNFFTDFVMLDKFANPVEKNGEPMFNPMMHQTWWLIDDPGPEWTVLLANQFGTQTWYVTHGRYLVLPALKDEPGDPPPWNHYKCYNAVGDPLDLPVDLLDQWGTYAGIVAFPELFCNPCQKEVPNGVFPIVEPEVHLACYRLEPLMMVDYQATAFDQFGVWPITAFETCWLCVPSYKLSAIATTETRTWSDVKTLYRN